MIKIQEVSAPGCTHCDQARKILEDIKTQFSNVEVEYVEMLSGQGQKMVQEYRFMSSPGIIVNGELFSSGGLDKNELIKKIQSLE